MNTVIRKLTIYRCGQILFHYALRQTKLCPQYGPDVPRITTSDITLPTIGQPSNTREELIHIFQNTRLYSLHRIPTYTTYGSGLSNNLFGYVRAVGKMESESHHYDSRLMKSSKTDLRLAELSKSLLFIFKPTDLNKLWGT